MSNLPKGWGKVPLKEVVEDMHQGINTVTENIEYYDNGIDILQTKHITGGYIDLSDPKKVSVEDYNKYKAKYQPQINHILLTNIGTIGKVLIVEENINFLIAWNIFLIKSNQSKINPYFLFYVLKKYDIDKFYDKFLTGNATKFINKKFMSDIEIPLPPLEEQKKIADILSTVDKKIAFVEENINATEELKKGLMQKLLTEGIGHTDFKDSELGRIPESWEVVQQSEVATFYNGRAYKLSEWEESGIPVIRLQNLTGTGTEYYYSTLQLPEHQYCINGDLLYMWSATFGPVWWKGEKAIYHYHIWKITTEKNKLDKNFLFYLLDQITIRMKKQSHGSTMIHVTKGGMEKLKIQLPPLEEQKQIVEILSTVDKKLENLKEKKQSFEELKKGLMQKLLTGEVRV